MQWFPPLNVETVDRGGPQVIIDSSLALDLHGPLLTLRMAQECDTWVPASVWRMLDESMIRMAPLLLNEDAPSPEPVSSIPERSAAVWERARVLTGNRRLYWLAECREDAHLPDWVPPESSVRFETLHEALNNVAADDATVDSLVLAATFQERAAAILCVAGDGPPSIVREASRRGIAVTEVPPHVTAEAKEQWFGPLLMRIGLSELSSAGHLPLAYVRLFAPDLLFFETEAFDAEDRDTSRVHDWPRSAFALWGRL
ncbi:MAG: hypothetical protein AAF762_02855 [Pseudomonadota bacterium]